jgi:hypothetical protein
MYNPCPLLELEILAKLIGFVGVIAFLEIFSSAVNGSSTHIPSLASTLILNDTPLCCNEFHSVVVNIVFPQEKH